MKIQDSTEMLFKRSLKRLSCPLLGLLGFFILSIILLQYSKILVDKSEPRSSLELIFGSENVLDGCFHVYLDIGSNVGIQTRKLFEPKSYPDAPILKVFDKDFGQIDEKGLRGGNVVCAIGFEPNPHHTQALLELQLSHKLCGMRSIFYTEVAASHKYGKIDFVTDNDVKNMEWGGGIVNNQRVNAGTRVSEVQQIRLADYILKRVLTRKIPENKQGKPFVMMKMDIEGSELEVLTDLIVTGALQYINFSFMEFHAGLFKPEEKRHKEIKELWNLIDWLSVTTKKYNMSSVIEYKAWDDETFHNSKVPLMKC